MESFSFVMLSQLDSDLQWLIAEKLNLTLCLGYDKDIEMLFTLGNI